MKRTFLLKMMLLLCALVAGSSSVWADEVVHYTLDGTVSGGNSNYAEDGGGLTQNGISWSVTGNTTENPWRIGGKSLSGVNREAYSKTEMGAAITKVELAVGDINLTSVNSITLIVASNSDFSTVLQTIEKTSITANSTLTFNPSGSDWATGAYYKFIFNVTQSTNSNKYIQFKSAKFYKEVTLVDPTITFDNGSVRVGKTLDLSTLFTSNSTGAVTYSITSGSSNASIDGSTLTGVATGDVTVKAQQAAKDEYNAGEKSATITVVDPDLSSITITTPPTKTEYDEGELFDATDMIVTATFADESTEDVTALCTWTPSGALTTSDTEVTISYTYNTVTKTATQNITVNAYEQPTEFDINLNNALFGTSYGGSASGITDDDPVIGTLNHVTITYAGSGNHYINDSQIRFYPNNKLTFEAPAGYVITQIVFTAAGDWKATISANKGTYTSDTKTWTGEASSVLFTGSGSNHCRIAKAAIILSSTAPVTITAATWASFSCDVPLDFTGTGVTAYIAKVKDDSNVTLTEITKVPANTGIVVNAPAETYAIPVLSGDADDTTGNLLKPWLTAGEPTETTYYTLAVSEGEPVFYTSTGGILAANKAYLVMPGNVTAPSLGVFFGGTTGMNDVRSKMEEVRSDFYNLNGQRVAQPTKGLYIVNGKKYIVK